MNAANETDRIDDLLRRDAAQATPDAVFSARVMAALPAPRTAPSRWKPFLVLGSAALGCAIAAFVDPAAPALLQGFADLAGARLATPAALAALATAGAMALTALVLAADAD